MLEMDLPPDPPDLYLYPSIEECAHRAWDWAYEVVQFNADDPENPTYEEHRQAHSLTISLLAHHLWTSIGIVPDNDRIQNLIDLIQVGWFRYARGKLIEHTHILEEEGVIDPIDPTMKLATQGHPVPGRGDETHHRRYLRRRGPRRPGPRLRAQRRYRPTPNWTMTTSSTKDRIPTAITVPIKQAELKGPAVPPALDACTEKPQICAAHQPSSFSNTASTSSPNSSKSTSWKSSSTSNGIPFHPNSATATPSASP